MKDGRKIRNKRLSIIGAKGVFKGVRFTPVSDSSSLVRISFEIDSCVGFKNADGGYDYYSLDDIPKVTHEISTNVDLLFSAQTIDDMKQALEKARLLDNITADVNTERIAVYNNKKN